MRDTRRGDRDVRCNTLARRAGQNNSEQVSQRVREGSLGARTDDQSDVGSILRVMEEDLSALAPADADADVRSL